MRLAVAKLSTIHSCFSVAPLHSNLAGFCKLMSWSLAQNWGDWEEDIKMYLHNVHVP